jgi:shikimate kinase
VAILVGPPGAGKSTVGPLLAGLLGTAFTDTDAAVEATAGKPVSDIFIDDGEPAFRALERQAAQAALGGAGGVIALGGGAVLDPEVQQLLSGQPVVYLETGFAAALSRTGLSQARPLLIGINPRAKLRELLDQRVPVYQRLAWITVRTDDAEPGQIAADIAGQIRSRGPVRGGSR